MLSDLLPFLRKEYHPKWKAMVGALYFKSIVINCIHICIKLRLNYIFFNEPHYLWKFYN